MNREIKLERFAEKKYLLTDFAIIISFIILFVATGFFENNLFLPDEGLGLFEHINIWIFIIVNFSVTGILFLNYMQLKNNISKNEIANFKNVFLVKSKKKWIRVVYNFLRIIGFCFFIGNSLQNAHVINPLPFKYWDSVDFIISYIISRFYKLYLFAYFMPLVFIYTIIIIISISELLRIKDNDLEEYPIKNYLQLNIFCTFGLNTMLTIIIPILLISGGIYLVHDRLDITTVSTIIVTVVCVIFLVILYVLLINKFYVSVIKYKEKHILKINSALSEIHRAILNTKEFEEHENISSLYLKKEEYLWQCKERIEKISEYPLIIKAIITIITPLVPTLIKVAALAFKHFLQIGNI